MKALFGKSAGGAGIRVLLALCAGNTMAALTAAAHMPPFAQGVCAGITGCAALQWMWAWRFEVTQA